MADQPTRTWADRLQSIKKPTIYAILILVTSIPLWFTMEVPNEPEISTVKLYETLKGIPEGSTVLLASDWTNSTRGESAGQFKALLRVLMRRKLKLAIYTSADPQAPKVSRDTLRALNTEQRNANLEPYREFYDWVNLGYFPSAEGTAVNIASDVRKAFASKKVGDPETKTQVDVFRSPVLANIRSVKDFPVLIVLTASKTSNITIERLYGKVPLAMMVTGVMGPETQVYFESGQLIGLSKGLKGVYDMETMMEKDFPGMKNRDQGSLYYPTLHFALALLIIMVIIGNVGVALARRSA